MKKKQIIAQHGKRKSARDLPLGKFVNTLAPGLSSTVGKDYPDLSTSLKSMKRNKGKVKPSSSLVDPHSLALRPKAVTEFNSILSINSSIVPLLFPAIYTIMDG